MMKGSPSSPVLWLARGLGGLCVVIFAVLLGCVVWGVVTRYMLGGQARWTEELARFLLVWLGFSGAALAYAGREHLGVDLLVGRLEGEARWLAEALGHAVVGGFSLVVLAGGGGHLFFERLAAGQMIPSLGVGKAWQYLAVPAGGVLMAVFAAGHLAVALRRAKTREGAQ